MGPSTQIEKSLDSVSGDNEILEKTPTVIEQSTSVVVATQIKDSEVKKPQSSLIESEHRLSRAWRDHNTAQREILRQMPTPEATFKQMSNDDDVYIQKGRQAKEDTVAVLCEIEGYCSSN